MTLHTCTFTGVDDRTDLTSAASLAAEYPIVEYGILFSRTRAGQENRYPADVVRIASVLRDRNPDVRLALHVCGRAVFELIAGSPSLRETTKPFDRVQLNFALGRVPFGIEQLQGWIAEFDKSVITQHNRANEAIAPQIADAKHQILFDSSGGAGIRSEGWPLALPGKACGFAGGIGPDTAEADLSAISETNPEVSFWIDMEGRVRSDDLFDLHKCERVIRAVAR